MLYFGMTDWSGQVTGAFENKIKKFLTNTREFDIINKLSRTTQDFKKKNKKFLTKRNAFDKISKLSKTTTHQLERVEKEK